MFFRKLRLTKNILNSMTTRLKSTGIPEDIQTAKNLVQHIESINDFHQHEDHQGNAQDNILDHYNPHVANCQ